MTHTTEELERLMAAHIESDTEESARELADAAVNALPELVAKVKRLEADLKVIASGWRYVAEPDNSLTKVDWTREQLIEYARAAIRAMGGE